MRTTLTVLASSIVCLAFTARASDAADASRTVTRGYEIRDAALMLLRENLSFDDTGRLHRPIEGLVLIGEVPTLWEMASHEARLFEEFTVSEVRAGVVYVVATPRMHDRFARRLAEVRELDWTSVHVAMSIVDVPGAVYRSLAGGPPASGPTSGLEREAVELLRSALASGVARRVDRVDLCVTSGDRARLVCGEWIEIDGQPHLVGTFAEASAQAGRGAGPVIIRALVRRFERDVARALPRQTVSYEGQVWCATGDVCLVQSHLESERDDRWRLVLVSAVVPREGGE